MRLWWSLKTPHSRCFWRWCRGWKVVKVKRQEIRDSSDLARPLLCPGSISPTDSGHRFVESRIAMCKVTIRWIHCPNLRTVALTRLSKYCAHLCWFTTCLSSRRAYLQLAIPFTFTQMPSFWQGFGSQGSLKYCGQLWSSNGPVFSTDRLRRLGCPWPRLPGKAFSDEAFPEPSTEVRCSWPWRTRPRGVSLVSLVGTSVFWRWVISWGNRQRVVRKIYSYYLIIILFHSWKKFWVASIPHGCHL